MQKQLLFGGGRRLQTSHPSPPKPPKPPPANSEKLKSKLKESEIKNKLQCRKNACEKNSNAKTTAMTTTLLFGRGGLQTSHPSLPEQPNPPPANSKKLTSKLKES